MNVVPVVSICCITYNQEQYLRTCLDKLLEQSVNFDYEIVIGEDCSTDSTLSIIKEYQEKHANIHVITSKKNVGMTNNFIRTVNCAKGKYIAFCEGDDYWTDSNKLQKQVDFLESNLDYSMCGHTTAIVDSRNNYTIKHFAKRQNSEEVAYEELEHGHIFHVSSIMCRAENIVNKFPEFFKNTSIGDYALSIWQGSLGKIYCINQEMSVYRKYNDQSWTVNTVGTVQRQIQMYDKVNSILKEFVEFDSEKSAIFAQKAIEHNQKNQNYLLELSKFPLLSITSSEDYNVIKNMQRVYIFGSGLWGVEVKRYLNNLEVEVVGFIDNNKNVIGLIVEGIPVCSLDSIGKHEEIMICSSWYGEIYNQLKLHEYHNIHIMQRIN